MNQIQWPSFRPSRSSAKARSYVPDCAPTNRLRSNGSSCGSTPDRLADECPDDAAHEGRRASGRRWRQARERIHEAEDVVVGEAIEQLHEAQDGVVRDVAEEAQRALQLGRLEARDQ